MANKCSTLLELHPSAISHASAFFTDTSLMISLALISFCTRSIMRMPAFFASMVRLAYAAGIVPLPGSAMPMASHRQFMLLAVYMPEHEPQPGQVPRSNSSSCSSSIRPALRAPTASNILDRLVLSPATLPASIGPPETTMEGRFSRTAAITMPGTILSQLGTSTSPSKQCANAIVSVLSAISSRLARLYFMPRCPMAMPSHTPMAGTSMGVPPAMRTPAFTASAILSR